MIVMIIALTYFGAKVYEKIIEWFITQIRKVPNVRKWLLFPLVLFPILLVILSLDDWDWKNLIVVVIAFYFIFIVPSAIISLLQEDLVKERRILPFNITREQIINNPQSAIQFAFSIIEDKLRKKLEKMNCMVKN